MLGMFKKYKHLVMYSQVWQALPIHCFSLLYIGISSELGPVNYNNFTYSELIKLVFYLIGSFSMLTTILIVFFDLQNILKDSYDNRDKHK